VKGILEMPVFSAVPWSSLNKELMSLAFGTGWLAIAGARKLVAAKREARLNASWGPLTVPHCWEFYDFRRHPA
jgi:hypothetical protein